MTFKDLGIIEPILKALSEKGYTHPTPIQEQSIPILLRNKDLMGCAQTGTGKTAAFAIPIIQHIANSQKNNRNNKIKALIVTPTRELAIQIADNFTIYGKHTGIRNTVIFGGVKQGKQTQALQRGVDILVATPGRLLDLMQQGYINLGSIEYFVLDEADQMLDMGFIHDIKKILAKLPSKRQSLFFSATMPSSIVELSRKILGDFDTVTVKPEQATAEKVEQAVYFVSKKAKIKLLVYILETQNIKSTLVFSRTKHGANKIVKLLDRDGIKAAAIHGNKSQTARQKALENFKKGIITVLVATDIAARGIDIDELALVVNYDLPNIPETYVHRIGRTGRAKASGIAISFCNQEERAYLRDIQKLINQKIPVITEHPFINVHDDSSEESSSQNNRNRSRSGNSSNRNKNRNRNQKNRRNSNSRDRK
ncbi:MAG TPA: DEAD/DEAH box helicase [Flavobacteriaceae bacterium]|jgi:ATP-dependent RNA helicase RhlE|nr:DEAD/DEAH box helicase [Flavobacteriaceae bacterium]HBS13290.1 DEAD/DEAH box helicase [Flavobacteriaceae bacterium]